MKVKFDREIVLSKLSKAIKFVPSKPAMPAFENFKLTIENGIMEVVGSDGNVQIKIKSPVSGKDNFSVCVHAGMLVKTMRLFTENEVTITLKSNSKVEIKSGKSKYNLTSSCLPEEFPMMKNDVVGNEINMPQFFLQKALKMTGDFVDGKTKVESIQGINIDEIENEIVFTGTNGNMVCRFSSKPISITKWEKVMIHTDTADKVSSLLNDRGEISISHDANKIIFFTDGESSDLFEVCATVSNAKFVNAERFFKDRSENLIIFNTAELKGAIKRLQLYSSSDTPSFSMNNVDGLTVLLKSVDEYMNRDGEELVTTTEEIKKDLVKCFNSEFFLNILGNIDSETFEFYYNEDQKKPCLIIPRVATEEEKMSSFLIVGLMI